MPQQSPVDAREPLVLLDLARARLTPKPLVLVLDQELLDDALADRRRCWVVGERDLVPEDVAERRVPVRAFERRAAAVKHLVDEDPERPPASLHQRPPPHEKLREQRTSRPPMSDRSP